ncbi:hypothetical protein BCR33DRAFT_643053, partial [Rhizoclosmatium globosum]
DYCEELENHLPEAGTVLLLIFGSDKALATKIGKQSFHPLVVSFGNLLKSHRKKLANIASMLVTYLPVVSGQTSFDSGGDFLREYTRAVHHAALSIILAEIHDWVDSGVELVSPDGRNRIFYPSLFNYNLDYPEGMMVSTGSQNNKMSPMPCCFIP